MHFDAISIFKGAAEKHHVEAMQLLSTINDDLILEGHVINLHGVVDDNAVLFWLPHILRY
jgi:hypothetical protein